MQYITLDSNNLQAQVLRTASMPQASPVMAQGMFAIVGTAKCS